MSSSCFTGFSRALWWILRLLQKNSFNLLTSLVEMQNLHPHSKTPTIDLEETGAMGAEGTVHPSLSHLGDKSQDLSV
ncbi:hypothetical protein Pmani_007164 [Petrolisthes manimaculis]|uniref:Uncharacterized protein n=1 Tax=Petrolisthes manimaculis TaxID=1843537 RepID=A0AAE1Q9H5_9EUCA|nr:hypothetical protein Pmani_007164 [Petrolisthes manimaculis]